MEMPQERVLNTAPAFFGLRFPRQPSSLAKAPAARQALLEPPPHSPASA